MANKSALDVLHERMKRNGQTPYAEKKGNELAEVKKRQTTQSAAVKQTTTETKTKSATEVLHERMKRNGEKTYAQRVAEKRTASVGNRLASTTVAKGVEKTTSHSGSSGTWAENSNSAYKQWAANNPAMAKAQEARSTVAKAVQETKRNAPAKKTTIVDDVANLIARDTESIDYKIADIERQMDAIDKERRTAYDAEVGYLRDGKWGYVEGAESATAELDRRYNELEAERGALVRNKEKNAKALKLHTYNALAGLEDFEKFSAQGASIANPGAEKVYAGEKTRHASGIGAQHLQNSLNFDDVQNKVAFVKDNWDNLAPHLQEWLKDTPYGKYRHLEEDEVNAYNYLLAKDGKEAADEYLDFIEETLNWREGTEIGEKKMSVKNDVLRTTLNTLYGLGAVGPDQWMSGTTQLLSSDRLPTSATQYAGQYIRENAGPVEGFFFDAGTVTGNMLPSILISKGTGLVGSALGWGAKAVGTASTIAGAAAVGTSASGNAYNQALGEGYTKEEARKYAALVGASEAGLSAVLGSNLVGGKINGLMKARIQGIDNALGRIAGHWALSTGGEVTEEVLQEYLEPAFRSLIFDVDYDAPNFEDVAYVALLTALSASAPGAVDAVATETTNSRTGKSVKASEGGVKGLLDNALALDPSTESHKKATALMNKKGEPNDAEIGDLKRTFAIDSVKADKDRIKAEVEKAKQFGEGSKASETATRIEEKLAKGKEVSDDDIAELLTDNAVAENDARSKQRAADADALVENAPAVEELVQQGRDLGGRASKEAERIASKVANGVEVTSNDIQRLMEVNENTKTAVDKYTKRVIDNAVARKITNYGEHGAQAFADAVNTSNGQDIRDVQLDFDTPYQAGLMNKSRNTMTFNTPLEKLAFNAGVQDYIAQRKIDKKHKAIVYTEEASTFDWTNAPADITQEEKNLAEFIVKNMGVAGDFSSAEQAYNAFYDPDTGKTTFDAGFGISPELTKKLGNLDYLKKVEKLANERGQSFTFYLAHEIATHRAMDLAPTEMRAFVNAMYTYKQSKTSGTNLARDKQDFYLSQNVSLSTEVAFEEVVADSILDLYDGDEQAFFDAIERIANGTDMNAKKGARTFLEWLSDTIERFKAWAKNLTGKAKASAEKDISSLEDLRNMFEKAIAKSIDTVEQARKSGKAVSAAPALTETTSADGTVVMTDKSGDPVAMMQQDGSAQFSLKTYEEFGRDELVKWLDKRVKEKKLTKEESADIVRQLDEFYEICGQFVDKYAPFGVWSQAEVVKGKNGKPAFSVVKANGDYAMNLDFSLVCKKRRTLDAVFGELINRGIMDDVELGEADIVRINDIIRESGFETACALCFVDSKRYRQASVADNFVNKYNELVEMLLPEGGDVSAHYFNYVGQAKANAGRGLHTLANADVSKGIQKLKQVMKENGEKTVPHKIAKHLLTHPEDRKFVRRSDFMNTDGFEEVSIKNPNIMKLYNSSKGSGGPKAAFSDVQYLGEILSKTNFTPARAYAVGGVRIQSFSDYVPRLVFDYLQMIGDLSAKKLPAHAYTKEALFAMQFGMTGIKVNMSLVPAVVEGGVAPGLDANGDYAWFDGQSFGSDVNVKGSGKTGFDLAVKIQNANGYSANCGTIAVGISEAHIRKMLDDPNIRMIIPYHKSSLNHIVAVMNNIDQYEDFTGRQNTRYADTGTKLDSKKHKDFNYNEALRRTGDAKAAADEYLAWCKKNNYIPKFDQFAWHENYYKLLEDFSTYDNGVAAPQGPVTMTFPKEGDAFGSMAQLIEQSLEEDAVLEGKREKALPEIVDKIEGALKKQTTTESGRKMFSLKGNTNTDARIAELESKLVTSVSVPVYSNGEVTKYITKENGRYKLTDDPAKAIAVKPSEQGAVDAYVASQYKKNPLRMIGTEQVAKPAKLSYAEKNLINDEISALRNGFETVADAKAYDQKRKNERLKADKASVDGSYFDQAARKGEPFYVEHGGEILCDYQSAVRTIVSEAKRMGAEEVYTSAKRGSKFGSSVYLKMNGVEVRISDHHLPQTMERSDINYNQRWDSELVLTNGKMIDLATKIKTRDDMLTFLNALFDTESIVEDYTDLGYTGNNNNGTTDGMEIVYGQRETNLDRDRRLEQTVYPRVATSSFYGDTKTLARGGAEARIHERGSGRRIFTQDSEGRRIDPKDAIRLQGTAIVDAEGRPILVRHATNTDFSVFAKGDIGFHFGSEIQARDRARQKGWAEYRVVYAYLNIKNPVHFRIDIGGWQPIAASLWLQSEGLFSAEEDLEIRHLWNDVDVRPPLERWYESKASTRLRDLLGEKGYDGIVYPNAIEGDGYSYISFYDEQIIRVEEPGAAKNAKKHSLKGEEEFRAEVKRIREEGKKAGKSTSEIDQEVGAFVGQQYAELIKEYGAISRGEKASREIEVPKKSEEDRPVSQTVRTILEAEVTPDTLVPQLQEMVTTGEFSYDVFSDKSAMDGAKRTIRAKGYSEALADWYNAVDSGKVNKANTALGWELYNQAANAGDGASAINILNRMVGHQRDAAQALQATRILKKLTPDAQLYSAVKEAQKIEDDLMKKFPKFDGIKIDETLAEEFMQAETQEERDRIMKEIYRDIGRQMPASWIDKFNAWRYMAMLTNPRTHIRNVIGNAAFAPLVLAKDLTASAIESTVNFVAKTTTGKSIGRTKGRVKSDLLKAAWEDFANAQDIVKGGGNKYNETANMNRYIEEGRRIYKTKPLEAVRKTNSNLLDLEDMWFSKPHYAYALAQYCSANGITAEQLKRGKALGNAREYAIREAQKATYRDTNAFSEMIGNIGRRRSANPAEKVVGGLMTGVLPFRKTPANILARGVGYSPIGLLKGFTYDLVMVGMGKKTAAEAIDSISAGLTGTGLIALGAFLAAQGLVRGAGGSDEEEKKFEELQGHQGYALELPDGTSVTLDWLAPEALPFFVGVNLYETTKEGKKGATAADLLTAITNISEPMLELSCLQSLNDVFDGLGYANANDTSPIVAVLASATTSYLTQYVPTILGQAERSTQGKRLTTYTEKDNWLTSDMQYTLGKTSARIPGWDFQQIPYIDAWGREESTGNPVANTANNFLNPAYTSKVESSAMEKELARLYDRTGESKVLPQRADKYFTVDGERKDLTATEYVKYATEKGKLSRELVTDLTKSKAYKKMDDADKAEAVSKAYAYANESAKKKVDSDFDPQSWVSKAMTANKKLGLDETDYILYQTALASADPGEKETVSKVDAIRSVGGLSDAQKAFLFDGKLNDGAAYKAHQAGVDMDDYLTYKIAMESLTWQKGKTGAKKAAVTKLLKSLGLEKHEYNYLYHKENGYK